MQVGARRARLCRWARPRPHRNPPSVAVRPAANHAYDLGADREYSARRHAGRPRRRTAGRRAGPPAGGGAAGRAGTPPPGGSRRPGMAAGPAAVPPGARVTPRAGCGPAARPRRRGREAPARRRSRRGQPGGRWAYGVPPVALRSKAGRGLSVLRCRDARGLGRTAGVATGRLGVTCVSGGSGRDRVAPLIYRSRQGGPTLG